MSRRIGPGGVLLLCALCALFPGCAGRKEAVREPAAPVVTAGPKVAIAPMENRSNDLAAQDLATSGTIKAGTGPRSGEVLGLNAIVTGAVTQFGVEQKSATYLVGASKTQTAEVVLDGVIQGKASDFSEERYLKAGSGTHRLELRAPGFEPYRREIYVSNSLMRIEETLVRRGERAPAAPGTGGRGGY